MASTGDELAAPMAAATIVSEEDPSKNIRRTHVDRLEEAVNAEVKVEAPGYEALLASTRWDELPLPADIIKGIIAAGWERPSKIQAQALPHILRPDRPNLLAQAKNGSGKTGSFGLGMLAAVDVKLQKPQAICICPTRELAIQTTKVLQTLARFTEPPISVTAVIGGVMYLEPIFTHCVVVTPGKVKEVINKRLLDLSAIKVFALDEADDMIENFAGECMFVKNTICRGRPKNPPQILLFSASFECLESSHPNATRAHNFTDQIIDAAVRKPVVIRVKSNELKLEHVTQFFVQVPPTKGRGRDAEFDAKLAFLLSMYDTLTVGKTMIFVETRKGAQALAAAMREHNHHPSVITGDREATMEDRVRVHEEFERGVTRVLICTDLMTRGIDMPGMKLVINFDLPWAHDYSREKGGHHGPPAGPRRIDMATFQHRVGRVGRFGVVGATIHMLANDEDVRALQDITKHFDLSMLALKPDCPDEAAVQVEEAMVKPPSMQTKTSAPAVPVFGLGGGAAAGGTAASAPGSAAASAAGASLALGSAAAIAFPSFNVAFGLPPGVAPAPVGATSTGDAPAAATASAVAPSADAPK